MSIVVTGATGHLGHLVVESLLDRGVEPDRILATGRRTEALEDLAARGVRTARLDFDDVDGSVLTAGDTLLLVSASVPGQRVRQHGNVLAAATEAGVARVVYTSAPSADDTTLVLAPEHAATEEMIRTSVLPFTILRNGWYTENYRQAYDQAAATGVLTDSTGEGRVSSATRADYAEATAAVLTQEGHEGAIFELSGDEAWNFEELAAAFGAALGRDVRREALHPQEHRTRLVGAGLDEDTAAFVVALDQNIAEGVLGVTTGDLARLAGRPTTPMRETVASWAH